MEAPVCDPRLLVKPPTSGDALAALDDAQREIVAGEVAQLVAITHIADLWKIDETVIADGMERLIRPGHDGTPKVGEFVALEVGALLGISPSSALSRIGEALDLRTRHPRLWQSVIAGRIRVWQAAKISRECVHLPLETVQSVDEAMAAGIGLLSFSRLMKALEGQIVAADTDLARERERARREARQIRVSKIRDGSVSIFGIVDPVDGINFDRLLIEVASALPIEPDTATCRDLDRRRGVAFGMFVRDAYSRAHEQEPIAELRYDELVPLPPGWLVGLTADDGAHNADGLCWVGADGPVPMSRPPGLLERVRAARALRQPKMTGAMSDDLHELDPLDALGYDIPIVEPAGCLKVLAARVPLADSGPLLYDTPVAEDLAGIAGASAPLVQTLVVHISAEDPALSAPGCAPGRTGVARVEGWGPLLTERLPDFLAGSKVIVRPVIDLADMRPVDCYETPAKMRFAIEQRNPVDVFPYGTTAASRCDMDHTIPYVCGQAGQAGQTSLTNLGPLSRKAHRAKTHGKWTLEQPIPGVYHWTSPHGYQYRVTAAGTTRVLVPETAETQR
ncbi:DUF222 domain-containing protein [Brooklawnia sp.]|uniref:DUF222 domain-containing protein n=1 Tax=Brooklawnia sp. TaxID=2699740 RepID=UPI00311FA6A6